MASYNSGIYKGKQKRLNPINTKIDNYYILPIIIFSLFLNGKSIIEYNYLNDNTKKLIDLLNQIGISILVDNNKLYIDGKENYTIETTIDVNNNYDLSIAFIFFSLLNQKTITIKNANIDNSGIIDILINGTKDGAIQEI